MKTHHIFLTVFLTGLVFISAVVLGVQTEPKLEQVPMGKFRLDVGKDLAKTADTTVLEMTVTINETAEELGTRLQFRYMDKLSVDTWSGGLSSKLRQKLLFVAQFKRKTAFGKESVLMYTFEHGMSLFSDLQPARGKKLEDVFRVTARSGVYDLDKPLVIGELMGNPITLSLEPPKKKAANNNMDTDKE